MKYSSFLTLVTISIVHFSLYSANDAQDKPKFVNFNVIFKDTAVGDTAIQSLGGLFYDGPGWLEKQKNFFNSCFGYSCSLGDFILNNKRKVFFGALFGLYAATQCRLMQLTKQLVNSNCWSLWHHEKSLESLFAIPQSQLGRELLTDVQRRYTTTENPTDFIRPLTLFLDDVEKEYKQLNEYKNLCRWMESLYIMRFSIVKTTLLQEIEDRIKRLAYIKNSFLTWVAEYKLEKRKRAA